MGKYDGTELGYNDRTTDGKFLSKVGIRYGRHCFCIFFVSVSKELLSDNITAHSISSGARSASDDGENIRYVSKFVLARIFVCVGV